MSYVHTVLAAHEKIVLNGRLSLIVFLPGASLLAFGLWLTRRADDSAPLRLLAQLVSIVGAIAVLRTALDFLTTEYTVTNQRLISKTGWISRRTTETFLAKVVGIWLRQDVIGRILGYGTVVVSAEGEQRNYFRTIAGPVEFVKAVQKEIEVPRL